MLCFGKRFESAKCKTLLKLVLIRIKSVRKKHEIQLKHMRLDVSRLLEIGEDENAETRVALVIREQNIIDGFNMIESFCERVIKQMSIIRAQKSCPTDLQEAISSLLFAGPRCAKLPELLKVRKVFTAKYGKDFVTAAIEPNKNSAVSKQIIEKLSSSIPIMGTKLKLMQEIALEHGIKWDPKALASKSCQQHGDSGGSNQSTTDAIINSRPKLVFPILGSGSLQSISEIQENHSIAKPPSLSSDDEDDVDFDARNQFIVSIMTIRTTVQTPRENDFQDTVLPAPLNPRVHHADLREKTYLQDNVQEIGEQSSADFFLNINGYRTESEYQIPYRDVITAAEAAAKSADCAAAAAKTAAALAMNARTRKASVVGVAIGSGKDVICEESTTSRFSYQEPAAEISSSSRHIPVRSSLALPVGVSVRRSRSNLQQQEVVQATGLLQVSPAMSGKRVSDGSSGVKDPVVDADRSTSSKKKVNVQSELANEYSSPKADENTVSFHERSAQQFESDPRLRPSEAGDTYDHRPSDKLFSNSGSSHRKEIRGVNTISSREHQLNLPTTQMARATVKVENSVGTVSSSPISVYANIIEQSQPEQKSFQDVGMGGKEQARRQENTKIHPVTSIPGIISTKGLKKSTSNSFTRIMQSCLSA